MVKEAIGTGATIEEAMQKAIASLCAGADEDVQFEVLATPKKKTLGLFGGSEAKVRAYVEVPDPAPKKEKQPRPRPEKQAKPEASAEKPKKAPAKKPAEPQKSETPKQKPSEAEPVTTPAQLPQVPASEVDPASSAGKAVAYLTSILEKLGCTGITMTVSELENGAQLNLNGEGLGVVIGRRGETLDALQYLTSLASNTGNGYYRVTLNIGNYREKRAQSLKNLARRTASQVLRTGRSRTLEPMNPYERRIIHTTVQEIEGVLSNSIGDGAGRRVVISAENKGPRADRSARVAQEQPARAPKKDASDLPLYGKIQ